MPEFRKVASITDIPAGQARMVDVNGTEIALFNVAGSFHASITVARMWRATV